MTKESRQLIRRLERAGYVCKTARHVKVYDRHGRMLSTFSTSLSRDGRAIKNTMADLRRSGVTV